MALFPTPSARGLRARALPLAVLLVALPEARGEVPTGTYVGFNAGRSQTSYDTRAYPDAVAGEANLFGSLDYTTWSGHRRADAWWAEAGYLGSPHLGLEASFVHLGEMSYRIGGRYTPPGGGAQSVVVATDLASSGPAIAGVLRLPLAPRFDVRLKLGDYYARTRLSNGLQVSSYTVTRTNASGSSLLLGAAGTYTIDGHWSARVDYLRVNQAGVASTGRYNADALTLGVSYTF